MSIINFLDESIFRYFPFYTLKTYLHIRDYLTVQPPNWSDLIGYETILEVIKNRNITDLKGEVVEVGSFLGGGTVKLANFFDKFNKEIYAIDIFKPNFDSTENTNGKQMKEIYKEKLGGKNQYEIYKYVIQGHENIITIKEDSKNVELRPSELCFSFIDGCHNPEYVRNDFKLVWDKTVSGGIVAFHDYDEDLYPVKNTIDKVISNNEDQIESKTVKRTKETLKNKKIIFLEKS